VRGLLLKSIDSESEQTLDCKGVFVAIGHIPNSQAFQKSLKLDAQGYFLTEGHSQVKTHLAGVYVAGDCADAVYRQAITAAGMGCQAAIEAERYLSHL
jgi:thioredoxin reductase (NADPH)